MSIADRLYVVWDIDGDEPVAEYLDRDSARRRTRGVDDLIVVEYTLTGEDSVTVSKSDLEEILAFVSWDSALDFEPEPKTTTEALNNLCEQTDNPKWKR